MKTITLNREQAQGIVDYLNRAIVTATDKDSGDEMSFNRRQAVSLMSLFEEWDGNYDPSFTLTVSEYDNRLLAWDTKYPEEGSVCL